MRREEIGEKSFPRLYDLTWEGRSGGRSGEESWTRRFVTLYFRIRVGGALEIYSKCRFCLHALTFVS